MFKSNNVKDKVIIVTGASSGIGKETAVALTRSGAHVVLVARRTDRLNSISRQLTQYPGKHLIIPGDIRDETFGPDIINQTVSTFGRVDALINNAGIGHRSDIVDLSPEDIYTIFNTNVIGLLFVTQSAVRQMRQQLSGHIIMVSSIVGQRPLPRSAVYCASKSALNFLGRSLYMENNAYNIRVSLLYPGLTQTEFAQARLGEKGLNRFGLRGVPAEKVANKIVQTIGSGRREVYVTWYDWLFNQMNHLFPSSIDWLITRWVHLA